MNDKRESESSSLNCELCPRNLDCANLFTALQLLKRSAKQEGSTGDSQLQYEAFKRRLEHLKFRYPKGQSSCLLSNNPELARALVQESVSLIRSMKSPAAS